MQNSRTPSTSDASTLGTQERNDNTTLANTVPEYPNRSNGSEFEVEKRNEVYPDQTPNTKVDEGKDSLDEKINKGKTSPDEEDWDISKNKSTPENGKDTNENNNDRKQSSSLNADSNKSEDENTQKSGLAETE